MTRNVDLTTAISFTRYDANSSKGMNRQQCNQNKKSFFFLIKCFDVEFLFGETGGILPFVVKSNKSISQSANIQDIRRIPTRLKIVTGTYILQTNRAVYSTHLISATCNLCRNADETLQHFVLCCEALQDIREPLINRIIAVGSAVLTNIKASQPIDILKLIINPFIYVDKYDITQKKSLDTIGEVLESLCRQLLYKIHNKRYELLGLIENKKRKNGKKK